MTSVLGLHEAFKASCDWRNQLTAVVSCSSAEENHDPDLRGHSGHHPGLHAGQLVGHVLRTSRGKQPVTSGARPKELPHDPLQDEESSAFSLFSSYARDRGDLMSCKAARTPTSSSSVSHQGAACTR